MEVREGREGLLKVIGGAKEREGGGGGGLGEVDVGGRREITDNGNSTKKKSPHFSWNELKYFSRKRCNYCK